MAQAHGTGLAQAWHRLMAQANGTGKGKTKTKTRAKVKAKKQSPTKKTKNATCAKREGILHETAGHEFTKTKQQTRWKVQKWMPMQQKHVFTIESTVKYVRLSQSGCERHDDGLVMIGCGASVIVCSKWFGESVLKKPDGSVRLRGADGRTLQDYGRRQTWLRIGNHLKR